ILSLEDAARVVAVRSRALSALDTVGGMVSVVMPEAAVRDLLDRWEGRLSVAAVNSPAATVVSGDPVALAEFEAELSARRILRWPVPASDFVAHSAAVNELAGVLGHELADLRPAAGRVRLFSTVTCEWADGPDLDAGYWYDNVRRTVRFEPAVRALVAAGHHTFVELSPHAVLTAAVTETAEDAGASDVLATGTLDREDAGAARLLAALARVHVQGVAVDWTAVLGGGRRVGLPTYAFQRQRYWLEPSRRERDRSVTEGWRYKVAWVPVPGLGAALSGTWLVVVPAETDLARTDPHLAAWCAASLAGHGARVMVIQASVT